MMTKESDSHPRVKEAVVQAEDTCTVSLAKDIMLARDLSNGFTRRYLEMKAAGASSQELNEFLDGHSQYYAQHLGDTEGAEICCGQVAGLITSVKTAREVVQDIVSGIDSSLEELKRKLVDFL